jgi:hypothetical protein
VIGRIVNCFEVGEKEDVPLSNSNSLCGIYASPCFAMDVVIGYGGFCSMETDYCYSLHYLRFQKTPTICSQDPFRIYYHL